MGDNPADFLGFNPLLASIEVKLYSQYANNDSIKKIEEKLKRFPAIQQVFYQKDVITMVNDNIQKVTIILLGLAAILLLISFVLINNTVRLSIYSNRFLINTMKLVGADRWFIRRPYIGRSVLNGIFAGVIALALLTGLVYYLQYNYGLQWGMISWQTAVITVGVVLVSGILLTAVSSFFAVNRYLRMRTDDMYFV
ncbi:MAG: FtsX-like permease family protein [Paludibacteraceae bacterium]